MVLVQADTRRGDARSWAAENVAHGARGSPCGSVYESPGIRSRLTADWRADLHADLGSPPLPPIPDDRFRGTLRNPAIDSSWYAAQYTQLTLPAGARSRVSVSSCGTRRMKRPAV